MAGTSQEQPSSSCNLRESQQPPFPDNDPTQQYSHSKQDQFNPSPADNQFKSPSCFESDDDDVCWMLADDVRYFLYHSYMHLYHTYVGYPIICSYTV